MSLFVCFMIFIALIPYCIYCAIKVSREQKKKAEYDLETRIEIELEEWRKEYFENLYNDMKKFEIEEARKQEKKLELEKQLKSVQYELYLMGKLDDFRPEDLTTEKDVKKALQLEKQYGALWQKERKLKRELEKLGA